MLSCTAISGVLPVFQCVNYKLQRAMEGFERSGIGVSRGREDCLFAGGGGEAVSLPLWSAASISMCKLQATESDGGV